MVLAHRLALATAGMTVVLMVFGGLVTNTGAALAVPDWPSTFGHNMFLFPPAQWVGGVFYEHSHRLLGAAVGLLTLALAAALWRTGGRLRALGLLAVVAVIVQGVLGGLRVVLLQDALAIVHGSVAPAFFALVVSIALLTRRLDPAPVADAALPALSLVAAALLYAQIVFGALLTHAGRLDLHLAGAVAVFAVLPVVTARARRGGDPVASAVARALLALLAGQLALGIGAYLSRFSPIWIPGGQLTMLVTPVAHRLVGALLFAGTVLLAVRAAGARRAAPAPSAAGMLETAR